MKKPNYSLRCDLHLGVDGEIIQWQPEKSSGLVKVAQLDEPIIFHLHDVENPQISPQIGKKVTIQAVYDAHALCWTATKITSEQRQQPMQKQQPISKKSAFSWQGVLFGLVATAVWLLVLAMTERWLIIPTIFMSVISFALFAIDKYKVRHQQWRIAESSLHLMDLLGGWCGGLLAMTALHHKIHKKSFLVIFTITVITHIAVICILHRMGIFQYLIQLVQQAA